MHRREATLLTVFFKLGVGKSKALAVALSDNYCEANPLSTVARGAIDLYLELPNKK